MNKTKIEWTDYTWNPVTGCWGPGGTAKKPNRCSYCYLELQYQEAGIPVFEKDSLGYLRGPGATLLQEWPR